MEPIIGAPSAGGGAAPADLIKESSTATFMEDVIEASRQAPVIVDFWAPWCGPCKQLGPVLEQAVNNAGGAVRMVKVNVDENQALAQQLRIQSIPAVFAFYNGQPVDAFSGALPESQVKEFVDRVIRAGGQEPTQSPVEEAMEQAAERQAEGDWETAAAIYRQVLTHEPDNIDAQAKLARCLVETGALDEAAGVIDALPADARDRPDAAAAISALELAQKAASTGDPAPLRARLDADPADHQARFDLAVALFGRGDREEAIAQLLELFKRDRQWNEEAARTQLLQFFEAMGPTDPITMDGRRKLSAMLFS